MTDQPDDAKTPMAPPPVPSDIGVVAALPIEVGPFLAKLKEVRKYAGARHTVHEGFCGEQLISLIITGPGRMAARRGAEILIGGHRPKWLVSTGFAGALVADLKRNTIVIPNRIIMESRDSIRIDYPSESLVVLPSNHSTLVTVDHIVRTATEKNQLHHTTGAELVDMETHAVAEIAADRGIRFFSLRVISDECDTDLPPEILSLVGPTGGYRVGAAIGAIWKRPGSIKEMLILRDHAGQAARVLAEGLPRFLERLV